MVVFSPTTWNPLSSGDSETSALVPLEKTVVGAAAEDLSVQPASVVNELWTVLVAV